MKKQNYLTGRWKAIGYVFTGMGKVLRSEHSIWAQWGFFMFNLMIAYYLDYVLWEWMVTILGWGMIFTAETLNTAIEKLADVVSPEYHPGIGDVKDISAGAVGWAAFTVLIIFITLFFKHLG